MSPWADALGSIAYGAGSAVVPVLNAEAYAVVTATRATPALALLLVVTLAAGQTAGKLLLFETARRGSGRLSGPLSARFARHGGARATRWTQRIRHGLSCRRTGLPLVFAAASLGLPPLAAVSLAAGTSGQRRGEFAAVCLLGRTCRFAVVALPAAYVLSR